MGIYYRLSGKKPLFTAVAASTLKSDSNFDGSRSVADLGFTTGPVEQTMQDIIAFQQQIFRPDADAVLGPERPIRPGKILYDRSPAWPLLDLGRPGWPKKRPVKPAGKQAFRT